MCKRYSLGVYIINLKMTDFIIFRLFFIFDYYISLIMLFVLLLHATTCKENKGNTLIMGIIIYIQNLLTVTRHLAHFFT